MNGVKAEVRWCDDCKSEHIGVVPCGMTWLERLRSTTTDMSWAPSDRTKKNYFDDESMKEMFGGMDRHERKELYMDETKGLGAITHDDIHKDGGRAAIEKERTFIESAPIVDDVV